ncbi:hypothetical protein AVMA1855_23620 [Acidovorax sp. SUPP1855]|nr:hypothetical protein AVMA1855_23620 [Acidovorax sp. SUPP1855]
MDQPLDILLPPLPGVQGCGRANAAALLARPPAAAWPVVA